MKKLISFTISVFVLSLTVIAQNVGIGTTTPLARLHVQGNALITNGGPLIMRDEPTNNSSNIWFQNAAGTSTHQIFHLANMLVIQKFPASQWDWVMDAAGNVGMNNTDPQVRLHIKGSGSPELFRIEGQTGAQMGLSISGVEKGFFNVTNDDIKIGTLATNDLGKFVIRVNGADRVFVLPDGRVGVGTSDVATGYMMSINGKAICTELKVQLQASWPDYVFHKNYQLRTFDDLRKYIAANNHLPDMPAAAEVEKSGLEVGEMQRKMMEKIEELTLYVLQLEKEISKLKENKE